MWIYILYTDFAVLIALVLLRYISNYFNNEECLLRPVRFWKKEADCEVCCCQLNVQ
jgi:hypothetical protein